MESILRDNGKNGLCGIINEKEKCTSYLQKVLKPGVVVHIFDPITRKAEEGTSLSLRPAWSTEQILEQVGIHRETLS